MAGSMRICIKILSPGKKLLVKGEKHINFVARFNRFMRTWRNW